MLPPVRYRRRIVLDSCYLSVKKKKKKIHMAAYGSQVCEHIRTYDCVWFIQWFALRLRPTKAKSHRNEAPHRVERRFFTKMDSQEAFWLLSRDETCQKLSPYWVEFFATWSIQIDSIFPCEKFFALSRNFILKDNWDLGLLMRAFKTKFSPPAYRVKLRAP